MMLHTETEEKHQQISHRSHLEMKQTYMRLCEVVLGQKEERDVICRYSYVIDVIINQEVQRLQILTIFVAGRMGKTEKVFVQRVGIQIFDDLKQHTK